MNLIRCYGFEWPEWLGIEFHSNDGDGEALAAKFRLVFAILKEPGFHLKHKLQKYFTDLSF